MCHDGIASKSFLQGFECILVEFGPCKWCTFVCELSEWGCYGEEIWDEPAAVVHKTQETPTSEALDGFGAFRMAVTVSSVGSIPFAEMVYPKNVTSKTLNLHLSDSVKVMIMFLLGFSKNNYVI